MSTFSNATNDISCKSRSIQGNSSRIIYLYYVEDHITINNETYKVYLGHVFTIDEAEEAHNLLSQENLFKYIL